MIEKEASDTRVVLGVEGMTCGGCVAGLERALRAAEGVDQVSVSLDPGQAIVEGTLDQAAVAALIVAAGYTAVS
jgi:copper chaperone CopZ